MAGALDGAFQGSARIDGCKMSSVFGGRIKVAVHLDAFGGMGGGFCQPLGARRLPLQTFFHRRGAIRFWPHSRDTHTCLSDVSLLVQGDDGRYAHHSITRGGMMELRVCTAGSHPE